jgi:ribosome-associated translation inhibitor RaiA
MLLFVASHGIEVTRRHRKRIEQRLRIAASRFERHVREIAVHVADVNGPLGGVDTVCRLTAKFHDGSAIRIEEKGASSMGAFGRAAKRFRAAISRRMGRIKTEMNRGVPPASATEIWIG